MMVWRFGCRLGVTKEGRTAPILLASDTRWGLRFLTVSAVTEGLEVRFPPGSQTFDFESKIFASFVAESESGLLLGLTRGVSAGCFQY